MTTPAASPSFIVQVPAGVVIRDPATGAVVFSGQCVPRNTFWRRLLESNEVGEQAPEPAPATEPAPKKKA